MNRRIIFTLLFLPCLSFSENERLNLDDVVGRHGFKTATLGKYEWLPNQDVYVKTGISGDSLSLYKIDLIKNDTTIFLNSRALYFGGEELKIKSFKFDRTGQKLLLLTEKEKIWRHSFWGTYFIINLHNLEIIPLSDENTRLRNVKFSPSGDKVAYVREDNNLYVFNINRNREKQLTRNGSEHILNGHRGWVYEEEFGSFDAYRWGPDSRFIAYWEENQKDVPEFILFDELELYPTIKKIHYPKAGQTNPILKIGIVNVKSGQKKWLDIGDNQDTYFPWMEWAGPTDLVVMRLNRLQKKLMFLNINTKSGKSFPGIIEEDSVGWINVNNSYKILQNNEMIWISERTGYQHLFRHNSDGSLIKQLTGGNWEVTKITHVDEEHQIVYFLANKSSVTENKLYSVDFEGNNFQLITPETGSHSIKFTPSGKYLIDSFSSIKAPRKIILKNVKGDIIRVLKDTDKTQYEKYDWSIPEIVNFETEDGREILDGIITLPVKFEVGKQYPVIIHGYGMPGTQIVRNRWGSVFNQFLAEQGYIVFSMDARGMSGRGEKFKNLSYGNMAKYLAMDHIAGIKWLIKQGYADKDRIGA
ncbi:MAG: DPP IV N-terminal domain-containing protein, partial [Candidatus Neomarinimicrobiota bacterium]